MLKILDKILGLGGLLDGQKTVIGAVLNIVAYAGSYFPGLPVEPVLSVLSQVGDMLFYAGLVHWRVKDLIKK